MRSILPDDDDDLIPLANNDSDGNESFLVGPLALVSIAIVC